MAKKSLTPEEKALLQKAMEGTKPFVNNKIRLYHKEKINTAAAAPYFEELESNESVIVDDVQGEAFISFKQSSISNKTLNQLRKGNYPIEAKLDLHGMKVEEAKN